jgi:hypothetical protein
MLTQLITNAFSLFFYTTFSHPDPPLKPLGLLYLLDKDATRVVLTQPLPRRMTRFTLLSPRPSSVKKMQTGLFFFRLTLLGMGLQLYKHQNQNQYQLLCLLDFFEQHFHFDNK